MHDYYDGLYKYLLNATFWFILLIVVLGIGMFGMLAYRGLKDNVKAKLFYTAWLLYLLIVAWRTRSPVLIVVCFNKSVKQFAFFVAFYRSTVQTVHEM